MFVLLEFCFLHLTDEDRNTDKGRIKLFLNIVVYVHDLSEEKGWGRGSKASEFFYSYIAV